MEQIQRNTRPSNNTRRFLALSIVLATLAVFALLFGTQSHQERNRLQEQLDSVTLASERLAQTAESSLEERTALMRIIALMAENQLDSATLLELLPSEEARKVVLDVLQHHAQRMHGVANLSATLEETEGLLRTTVQLLEEHTTTSQRTVNAQRDSLLEAANELHHLRRALDTTSSLLATSMRAYEKLTFAKNGARVTYIGEVDGGMANGRGTGLWSTGGTYEGHWKNNLRHGQGIYVWADGERYEGTFVDGKRTGFGIYTFKNGEQYKGEWLDDKRHGKGLHMRANGDTVVVGTWAADRFKERQRAPLHSD